MKKPLSRCTHALLVLSALAMAGSALASAPASAPKSPKSNDTNANCSLLYPGQLDNSGNGCVTPGWFGTTYNGYLSGDSPCFSDAGAAITAMKNNALCKEASTVGSCTLLYPGQLDNSGDDCAALGGRFGVMYNGYLTGNDPCFNDAGAAIAAMKADAACQ